MDVTIKQKRNHGHKGQICDCQRRGGGVSRHKLLYIEWINNKVLLYSMRNYIQYPMINHNGKQFKDKRMYMCIIESLCYMKKVKVKSLSRVRLFATPWTVAYQAPLSMGFSRQQYWRELPFPSPGDLPKPGIEPGSPALQTDTLLSEPPRKSIIYMYVYIYTYTYTHSFKIFFPIMVYHRILNIVVYAIQQDLVVYPFCV